MTEAKEPLYPVGTGFQHWYTPEKLYAGGYPKGVTSALKVFPDLAFEIQRIVVSIAPKRALEVGPGDRPVIGSVAKAFYLDRVPGFLQRCEGRRVVGDAREMPFKPGSFDLVVASDLLTHIPPAERTLALAELLQLAPKVLIFNPAEGTPEVVGSPVASDEVAEMLEDEGFEVERRDFVARVKDKQYKMALIFGERSGKPAPPPAPAPKYEKPAHAPKPGKKSRRKP